MEAEERTGVLEQVSRGQAQCKGEAQTLTPGRSPLRSLQTDRGNQELTQGQQRGSHGCRQPTPETNSSSFHSKAAVFQISQSSLPKALPAPAPQPPHSTRGALQGSPAPHPSLRLG